MVLSGYWESLIGRGPALEMAFAGILSGARCQLPRARITDKIAAVATESQEHSRPRAKGIYLLPNLLTTGCLFSGFYAVVAAIDKHFDHAGLAGFFAMIFGTLDRRISRLTRSQSLLSQVTRRLA